MAVKLYALFDRGGNVGPISGRADGPWNVDYPDLHVEVAVKVHDHVKVDVHVEGSGIHS